MAFQCSFIQCYSSKFITFVEKWKDVTKEGVKLCKPDTMRAVENLKCHILMGCLSDIPPGGGTNKNERLHQELL